ncbi:MAG: F390 synthetase-related protein [Thermoplasmatota archaeon]
MNTVRKLLVVRRLKKNLYNMSTEEIIRHQGDRVRIMGEFVKKNSPYYRAILKDVEYFSVSSFMKMDKSTMMENFDSINTRKLKKAELLEFAINREGSNSMDLFRNEYSVGMSSGTSGNRGLTVLSKDEMAQYSCLLWARNGIPEKIRKKRILFALRINSPAFMEVRKFGVKIIYVDYTHPVRDLIDKINEEKLNILAGPPSLLSMISRERKRIKHDIDCIISYAEVLTDTVNAFLRDSFDAPVIQIYQGSEGFIGTTCREGNLHINEDVLLVNLEDIPNSDDDAKRVIVTDLYRTTQPILNYQLNDLVEPGDINCPCGSSFRTIKRIHGRMDDVFILRGPDEDRRYLFPDYVRRSIISASGRITSYQAIQHDVDKIEIRLVVEPGSGIDEIRNSVLYNLHHRAEKIGGILGDVEFSDSTPQPNPRSGKMIRVVREYKEDI